MKDMLHMASNKSFSTYIQTSWLLAHDQVHAKTLQANKQLLTFHSHKLKVQS